MRIHISNGMDFVASSRFGRESDRQLERRRELERGRAFGPGGTTKLGSRNFETCSESLFLCFIELALALGPGFSTEETPRELESVRSRSLRRTARAALLVCTLASRHSAFSILNFSAVSDLFSALSFSYETVKIGREERGVSALPARAHASPHTCGAPSRIQALHHERATSWARVSSACERPV